MGLLGGKQSSELKFILSSSSYFWCESCWTIRREERKVKFNTKIMQVKKHELSMVDERMSD